MTPGDPVLRYLVVFLPSICRISPQCIRATCSFSVQMTLPPSNVGCLRPTFWDNHASTPPIACGCPSSLCATLYIWVSILSRVPGFPPSIMTSLPVLLGPVDTHWPFLLPPPVLVLLAPLFLVTRRLPPNSVGSCQSFK